ncbi:MAG: hypothetical protein A3D31_02680 [Candidatus Fluviicola riflensis]|nr:MAG: hypothetical protein CHH17_12360 [Candidatus Fluviicola riflensis]OGS78895.1 MAG: hypothetical protein A3D31_02680 [Candidatus Fluviicola riflensis]OGS85917.1 MAG: hypothetical protein A3E30_10165 [Fluviicola sp. RIFCSPHIGHO2_12_FULL_43_24]OGS86326.1 MAG: hypothetical protein A2724_02135 [Fluviicola sp. RIFCSPHIGHO2_01_FULL_43_53]
MRILLFIALGFLAVRCSSDIDTPAAPDDLVSRDTMVMVIRELSVLESYAQTRYQLVNNYHKLMKSSGRVCLDKYRIDPRRFERSYNYYASQQEELQSIYSEVMDSLTKEVNALTISYGKQDDTVQVAPL